MVVSASGMRVLCVVLGLIPGTRLAVSAADTAGPGTAAASAATVASSLIVVAPHFDFGTVPAGTVVEHDFVLENRGTAAARVEKVRSSCGCTAGQASAAEIPPAGTSTVHVRFDSAGRSGRQDRTVVITSTAAPTHSPLVCRLTGTVAAAPLAPVAAATPAPKPEPIPTPTAPAVAVPATGSALASASERLLGNGAPVIDFGRVWSDERPQREVTLTNTGTEPRRILAVTDDCACFSSSLDRRVLAPGESALLRLRLHPGAARRELQQTVSVASDEVGAAPWTVHVRGQVVPRLEATPASLHLLNTPAGSTVEQVLTVFSNEDVAFQITRLDCAVPGLHLEALPGGNGRAASLRCRFTAPHVSGPLAGVVSIVTDRPLGGTITLRVFGTVTTSGGPS